MVGSSWRRALALIVLLVGTVTCSGNEGDWGESKPRLKQAGSALGSNESPVYIGNWTQLTQMTASGNYVLTANIDAAGKTWTPKVFNGTFDGGNHRISNLTLNVGSGGNAAFFDTLNNAIVRRVKFLNLNVTGTFFVGGLAAYSLDSNIELVAVEGTVSGPYGFAMGGIVGEMIGGNLTRSYFKGTVSGSRVYIGGLIGFLSNGATQGTVQRCYAQATVTADTSIPNQTVYTGGLVGNTFAGYVEDVYAVGNVTGRGVVGGLVGFLNCDSIQGFVINRGFYRGNVIDRNIGGQSGGWAGAVGGFNNCGARFEKLFWDNNLDPSTNYIVNQGQTGASSQDLKAPTTADGGILAGGDNNFSETEWNAGTSTQYHILRSMPGPNYQPR
jgi:hypothetical protein